MLDTIDPPRRSPSKPPPAPSRWISAVAPTEEEQQKLLREHHVPEEFIRHSLDPNERPRTERTEQCSLVVLQVPVPTSNGAKIPFQTIPFGLIVTPAAVVTICIQENEVLEGLRKYTNEVQPEHPGRIVLHAMTVTAELFLRYLSAIESATDALEERLQASLENAEVLELLRYQKSLVYFTTALRSNALLLERLQHQPTFHLQDEDHELLEDALIELRQAIEMSTVSSELLAGLMDAFASIISNNLNVVMKALTALTVVLLFPSIVAGLYGMNVSLPGQHAAHAFWFAVGGSFSVAGIVALLFRKRGWL